MTVHRLSKIKYKIIMKIMMINYCNKKRYIIRAINKMIIKMRCKKIISVMKRII